MGWNLYFLIYYCLIYIHEKGYQIYLTCIILIAFFDICYFKNKKIVYKTKNMHIEDMIEAFLTPYQFKWNIYTYKCKKIQ